MESKIWPDTRLKLDSPLSNTCQVQRTSPAVRTSWGQAAPHLGTPSPGVRGTRGEGTAESRPAHQTGRKRQGKGEQGGFGQQSAACVLQASQPEE